MTFEERRQAHIERLRTAGRRAAGESEAAYARSHAMTDAIPFGQPILVGHHSEGRDRNYRNRAWDLMGKSVRLGEEAKELERRAEAAENNKAVFSDDPQAAEKLKAKIEEAEKYQATMKAINKAWQNHGRPVGANAEKWEKIFIETKATSAAISHCCRDLIRGLVDRPFPGYALTNNSANIRRMKERLAQIETQPQRETREREEQGIQIIENAEENRIQLIFPGKPDEEIRSILKSCGFRWSPYNGAWQRQLNNAGIAAADYVLSKIKAAIHKAEGED